MSSTTKSSVSMPIYKNPECSTEDRVADLMSQMTLPEKLGQLNQLFSEHEFPIKKELCDQVAQGRISSFIWAKADPKERNRLQRMAVEQTRLGIPLIFGMDIIHGNRTIFPIAPGMACSFEPSLFERVQAVAAKETRAEGVEWIFTPMCDLARDARWGRVAETCGEDPYLSELCNVAQVHGLQGRDPAAEDRVASCLKHFVGYSSPRGGRDYSDTEITEWTLRNSHLPPFKRCVDEGAMTIMSGFNAIGGVPSVANHHTLTEILRDEWSFKGFVVSDWNAVLEQISWGYAKDKADAAALALEAGNDMDMLGECFIETLEAEIEAGRVSVSSVDEALRRVLQIKFEVGLFDRPYVDEQAYESVILQEDALALAREAVQKSTVMLKNDNAVLPISKKVKHIALIGPFADDQAEMVGVWPGRAVPSDAVTLKEGLEKRYGSDVKITTLKACAIANGTRMVCLQDGSTVVDEDAPQEPVENQIADAVALAQEADLVIMAIGENRGLTGEGGSRGTLGLSGQQEELFCAVAEATSQPIVSVVFSGRCLTIPEVFDHSDAILLAWQPGVQAGHGLADLLSGDVSPSAKLSMSVPYHVGQMPIYYNHYVTGRPNDGMYRDEIPTAARHWFGYGLTYTHFEYGALKLTPKTAESPAVVSVSIKNCGDREGVDVPQLYIRQMSCRHAARPMQELKNFKKCTLRPGESCEVSFALDDEVLGYVGRGGEQRVDEVEFQVWIAPQSRVGEPVIYRHSK